MKRAWNAVKRFRWVIYCASVAALDFTPAALTGRWINYAIGAVMVACAAISLYSARTRKATPVASSGDLSKAMTHYLNGISATASYTPTTLAKPTAKQPGEFAGLPFDFAIGEVYGLRMWRMDQYGRLRARNWSGAEPWRPGVNVARCVPRADDGYPGWYLTVSGLSTPPKPAPKPPHDTPSESCTCGFYAYTDSRHAETLSYEDSHVILGIVKGTGRTLMGTQGFRCEKAEIVAFRDPTRGGTKTDPWRKGQLANLKRVYPDVPILDSREALLDFAPVTSLLPDPSTDEFWALP